MSPLYGRFCKNIFLMVLWLRSYALCIDNSCIQSRDWYFLLPNFQFYSIEVRILLFIIKKSTLNKIGIFRQLLNGQIGFVREKHFKQSETEKLSISKLTPKYQSKLQKNTFLRQYYLVSLRSLVISTSKARILISVSLGLCPNHARVAI